MTGRAATPPLFETHGRAGQGGRAGGGCAARAEVLRALKEPRRTERRPRRRSRPPLRSRATSSARSSPRTCAAGSTPTVVTRFPPEPNGYLHLGHAKSICLNFGIAQEFGGRCHLRFDDTNPTKEEQEYIDSIKEDVRWLGFDWGEHLYHASDYFEQLYEWAVLLIKDGQGLRGRPHRRPDPRVPRARSPSPGRNSPWRDRTRGGEPRPLPRMREGEFPDGARVLRAKIDMASRQHQPARPRDVPDPARLPSHAPGDAWCIYPTLRLRARPVRRHRGHHPLASARWSSRTTGRSTTGSWRTCPCPRGRGRSSSRA